MDKKSLVGECELTASASWAISSILLGYFKETMTPQVNKS